MKIFELEVSYFSALDWNYVTIKIQALTVFSLMKTFINEVKYSCRNDKFKGIWNNHKEYITEVELTFPKITYLQS